MVPLESIGIPTVSYTLGDYMGPYSRSRTRQGQEQQAYALYRFSMWAVG